MQDEEEATIDYARHQAQQKEAGKASMEETIDFARHQARNRAQPHNSGSGGLAAEQLQAKQPRASMPQVPKPELFSPPKDFGVAQQSPASRLSSPSPFAGHSPRAPRRGPPRGVEQRSLPASPAQFSQRRPLWKSLLATLSGLLLILFLLSVWRFRAAVSAQQEQLEWAQLEIADGNYGSRLKAQEFLSTSVVPEDPFTQMGRSLAQLVGGQALNRAEEKRQALICRLEAERLSLFGERQRQERVEELVNGLEESSELNAVIADLLLKLYKGQPGLAQVRLEQLREAARNTADGQLLFARLSLARGHSEEALNYLETASQIEPRHIQAQALQAKIKALQNDPQALQIYDKLLEQQEHLPSLIAREQLRINLRQNPRRAFERLKMLLSREQLSPRERASIHEGMGRYYILAGNESSAQTAFKAAMQSAQGDPRFSASFAEVLLRSYELSRAEPMLKEAIRLQPASVQYRVSLTHLYLLRGDSAGALLQLKSIKRPSLWALLLKAEAHLSQDDPEAAEATLREVLRLHADHLEARIIHTLSAYLLGGDRAERNLKRLSRFKELSEEDRLKLSRPALPWLAHGMALSHARKSTEAVQVLQAGLKIDPKEFRLHNELCHVYSRNFEARKALVSCHSALSINPFYIPAADTAARIAEAHEDYGAVLSALDPLARSGLTGRTLRRLARAYIYQRRPEKALALLEAQSTLEADRNYIRGLIAKQRNQLPQARPLLLTAADALSSDLWAQLAYGELLMRLGEPKRAMPFFKRAMRVGNGPWASLAASRSALAQRDWKGALALARLAMRKSKRSLSHPRQRAESLTLQALALLQSGRAVNTRKAKQLLDKAQSVEHSHPRALMALGLWFDRKKDLERTLHTLHRAAKVAPADPEIGFYYAQILYKTQGTRAQGLRELGRVMKLDPKGIWGRRASDLSKR